MRPSINKKLLVLKLHLFCFFGALGSVWPFFTLHMYQLGLNVEEIAVINLILPFVAAFCKPFLGIIADKTGKIKVMLSVMIITTGIFFTFLLLVPPVTTTLSEVNDDFVSLFTCNESGARVTSEICWNETNVFHFNWTVISLEECNYQCNNLNQTPLPKICFLSKEMTQRCVSLTHNDKISFSVPAINFDQTKSQCEYQIGKSRMQGVLATDLECPSPGSGCEVKCKSALAAHEASSRRAKAKRSTLTFWLYLVLRCFAETILSGCNPLNDVITLNLTGRFGGSFGQQQLVSILALGIFGPISGVIVDLVRQKTGKTSYLPCFILADIMLAFNFVALHMLPSIETKDFKLQSSSLNTFKAMRHLLSNISLVILFFICCALGIMWGYMETFLYLYILQNRGPRFLIGLTQLVSALPALPILYSSGPIMDKIGQVNLIIFAFFMYSVRCVGYVFLLNPWWSLLLESTRVFTLYLPRLCFTMYANNLAPPELKVTTQSLVFLLHFDVGRGLGSLVGGSLKDALGDKTTFQITAVYSGLLGCAYFALYHFYLKDIHLKQTKKPSLNSSVHKRDQNGIPIKSTQNCHVNEPLL